MKKTLCIILVLVAFLCQSCHVVNTSYTYLPDAYTQVIADYETLIDFRLSDDFEALHNADVCPAISEVLNSQIQQNFAHEWSCMLVEMVQGLETAKKSCFGYFLYDINQDDLPELFGVRSDKTILAVFSIDMQKAVLLDAYWSEYACVLMDSGVLYTRSSGGYNYITYKMITYDARDLTKTVIKEFGIDALAYYEVTNGKTNTISKESFQQLLSRDPFKHTVSWDNVQIFYYQG